MCSTSSNFTVHIQSNASTNKDDQLNAVYYGHFIIIRTENRNQMQQVMTFLNVIDSYTLNVCYSWNECQYHHIESNAIECSSYIGCQLSTIYQKGIGGEISCSGAASCQSANSLIAEGNVQCSGHRACYTVKPIVAETIQCSGSYSCFCDGSEAKGYALSALNQVSCGALKSCAYCKIKSEKNAICDGTKYIQYVSV